MLRKFLYLIVVALFLAIPQSVIAGAGDLVEVPGSAEITTVGTITTGTWAATDVGVEHGGTGVSTLTDHGVMLGSGTGAVTVTAVGADGQVFLGATGADPTWQTMGGDATISAAGAVAVADDSHAHTTTTISGLDISADTNLSAGSGIVLTGDALSHSTADPYKHIPTAGASTQVLQYSAAGTAKWITASGDATIADGGAVTVANDSHTHGVSTGGTGASTLTDGGLLVGAGTSPIEALAVGLTTQVLVGGGAGTNPAWGTDLPTALTIGSAYIYRAGGTDVADADVADNITITNLSQVGDVTASVATVNALDDGLVTQILVGGGAGVTPVWGANLPTAVTIGSAYIYRAAGTDVPVTDGGTGASTAAAAATNLGLGTGDSPTFVTVKATGLTDGYLPKHTSDAVGLANSPVYTDGTNVGIGTASPARTLDIVAAQYGGLRLSDSATNATNKFTRIFNRHYTNAEEDVVIVHHQSTSAATALYIGGGVASLNSATSIDFYTGATKTTLGGTSRMTINSSGNVGIGDSTPDFKLEVAGSIGLKEMAAAIADEAGTGQIWVGNTTPNELWFTDDAGTDTQISSHPLDAPSAMYAYGPGLDWIGKRVQKYLGIIFWQTINGTVTEETFDAYNLRRKNEPGHVDLIKRDWNTVQLAKLRAEKLAEVIEEEVLIADAFEEVEIMEEVQTGTIEEGYTYTIDEQNKVKVKKKLVPVKTKQGTGRFEKRLKSSIFFDETTGKFIRKRNRTEAEVDALALVVPPMPPWMQARLTP